MRYSLFAFSSWLFIFHLEYLCNPVYAQFSNLKFEYFTVDQGLPSNGTRCMFRDSKGYLWIGTQQGLCRYDGIKFKVYKSSNNDNRSLSYNDVFCIFEDSKQNLWIGTAHGLNLLDRKTETFTRFFSDSINTTSLTNSFVTNIIEDKKGNLWVNTHNGINKWIPQSQSFERHYISGKVNRTRPLYADNISFDSEGNIWGIRGERLWCFNPKTLQFKTYSDKTVGTAFREETLVEVDNTDIVWIGTRTNGLYSFNPKTDKFINYNTKGDGTGTNSLIIADLQVVGDNIIIATDPGGINKLNIKTNTFEYCPPNDDLENGLNTPNLWSIYIDDEGIIYAGGGNGVNIYNTRKNKFKSYEFSRKINNSLVNNEVNCFFEDSKGLIWIGTFKGISVFDPKKRTFTNHTHNPSNKNSISSNSVLCFAEDKNNDIWLGTYETGLNKFERKTGKFYSNFTNLNGRSFTSDSYVLDMVRMPDETIWLSLFPKGIGILDVDKGIITIGNSNKFDKVNNLDTWIDRFVKLPNSELAFITPKGLGIYNYVKNTFYYENILRGIHIMDLCVDSCSKYIATYNKGFWEIPFNSESTNNSVFKFETSATILGLLNDKNDNIWISTAEDLQRFNIKTKATVHYYYFEGLQKWYSGYARLKASDGTFYFGGTKGISSFNPDEISINTYLPTVIINEFQIFNKPVLPTSPNSQLKVVIEETKELNLSYKDAVFSFGFIAINFTYHEKTKYAYKLEGYDKEWNYTDETRKYASYSNIDPGNYTFLVKATNNDGVWNEQPTILKITITPPWWKTWWFRILLIFGVFGLLQVIYLFRVNALKRQQIKLEYKVKIRTEQLQEANTLLEERQEEITQSSELVANQKEEIEAQYINIKTLTELGQKITASVKVQEIIKRVYIAINSLMDAPSFSIGQLNATTNSIDYWGYSQKNAPMNFDTVSLADEQRMSVWCVNHKQIVFMNDVENEVHKYFNKRIKGYTGNDIPKSSIYLPLLSFEQNVIGILTVKSYVKNSYTEFHLNVLKNLAAYISIALDNARVYNELELQSEKIKEMDMLKTRFFINISHEFRTPLTLILGPIESMITDFKKEDLIESVSKLELVNRNAKRLLNLVNQLIDIHKIESGSMRLKVTKTNIGVFVNEIAELFKQLAIERNIYVSLPINTNPIDVYIDVEKMEKVIFNLLSNAFKYNKSGGEIKIEINRKNEISRNNNFVEIKIKDTGIGISSKSLPYIFEHFYQAINAQSTMEESSGIGLSLCKSLVELHHGTINVQSIENEGSTFTVKIPQGNEHFKPEDIKEITNDQLIIRADQLRMTNDKLDTDIKQLTPYSQFPTSDFGLRTSDFRLPTSNSRIRTSDFQLPTSDSPLQTPDFGLRTSDFRLPTSDFRLPSILVVDDNADMRTYIKSELQGEYQIIEAANGAEGFEKALEHNPELIISDVMMPVTDGIEFCNNIKTNELTSHIPVILLTAKNTEESTIEGFTSGADDYITKPFSAAILKSRIKNILQTREMLRQIYSREIKVESKAITLNPTDEKFMSKVLSVVEKNIDNPEFTVIQLANEVFMSYRNLHRKITALTGENVNEFISSVRMKTSVKLLSETDLSISEIAIKVGFIDPNNFSTHFKKVIGKSPSQFRQGPIIN